MPPIIKTVGQGIVLILILLSAGFAANRSGLGVNLDQELVNLYANNSGIWGKLIFFGLESLWTAVGMPRQVISFIAGYTFGLVVGFLLAIFATGMGCIICFFVARFVGQEFITKRFPKSIKNADTFLKNNTFAVTLLVRLFPLGSNFATNLGAGISSARPSLFFTGSFIGYIPQTIIFALLGSGISLNPEIRISLSIILFAISTTLGIYLFKVYKKTKN